MQQYDPEMTISYLDIVSGILIYFKKFYEYSDIIKYFGPNVFTDITDTPEIQMMNTIDPLPIGFDQKTFQFKDSNNYRGIFDVTFYKGQLVNFRAQIFFTGWFALGKAIKFNSFKLRPLNK